MRKHERWILAVLLAGNAVLWYGRLSADAPRRFDFAGFQSAVRTTVPEVQLSAVRFRDESLLPADYLYLEARAPDPTLFSVYVGHYPRRDLLADELHDPRVCYPAVGFEVLDGPDEVVMPVAGAELLTMQRLVAAQRGVRRLVVYWRQDHGGLGPRAGGLLADLADLWRRYRGGRSDTVWVRVEFLADHVSALDDAWMRRLHEIRRAASAAAR